jgi:hypothetical protein
MASEDQFRAGWIPRPKVRSNKLGKQAPIYRSLRSLEPSLSSPALHLPYTACQTHAKLVVAEPECRPTSRTSIGRGGGAVHGQRRPVSRRLDPEANLEPSLSSPALHLPYTACQTHAKLVVAE